MVLVTSKVAPLVVGGGVAADSVTPRCRLQQTGGAAEERKDLSKFIDPGDLGGFSGLIELKDGNTAFAGRSCRPAQNDGASLRDALIAVIEQQDIEHSSCRDAIYVSV